MEQGGPPDWRAAFVWLDLPFSAKMVETGNSAAALNHKSHMRHALMLAERALGVVAPNPAVGCLVVTTDDRVVGRGWTQPGGRPHAEALALEQAGAAARGATAYVTLEPCAHHGHTPPCAEALIAAGVAQVVAAVEDPDPRVRGKGFAMLRSAGVGVVVGVLVKQAVRLNAGFFARVQNDRPHITCKIAQSFDGRTIPLRTGDWITGEEARRFAHLLRAKHDAVLIGIDTVLADNPMLDCRLPGLEDRSPIRIVLDSQLRLPETSKVAQTARVIPTMVFTTAHGGDQLRALGVEVLRVMYDKKDRPDLTAVLGALAGRGTTRVLVEGGATVISSFLAENHCDRLEIFTAPKTLGKSAGGEVRLLADIVGSGRFRLVSERMFGFDKLESYALTS